MEVKFYKRKKNNHVVLIVGYSLRHGESISVKATVLELLSTAVQMKHLLNTSSYFQYSAIYTFHHPLKMFNLMNTNNLVTSL